MRDVTFSEEEYKIMVNALIKLRNEYLDNEIIKCDINDILEKLLYSPKKKNIFKNREER